jgi:hypothetical protein
VSRGNAIGSEPGGNLREGHAFGSVRVDGRFNLRRNGSGSPQPNARRSLALQSFSGSLADQPAL